jgi:hypothetical protein
MLKDDVPDTLRDPVGRTGGGDPAEAVADEDDVVEVFPFEDVDQVLHEDVSVMFFEIRWERSPRPVWVGVYTRWPAARNGSATRLQHQPPCQAPCSSTNVFVLLGAGPARPAAQRAVPKLAIAAAVAAKKVRLPCITPSLRLEIASQGGYGRRSRKQANAAPRISSFSPSNEHESELA